MKRLFLTSCFLLSAAVLIFGCGQKTKSYEIRSDVFEYHPASDPSQNLSLKYTLLAFGSPKKAEKFPLMILLHGNGQKGMTYIHYWEKIAAQKRMMLVAPDWERFPRGGKEDVAEYSQLVQSLERRFPIDSQRVYILGVSSGTVIGRWVMQSDPARWAKLVSVGTQVGEHWMKGEDLREYPPILYIHGAKDPTKPEEILEQAEWVREAGGQADVMIDPNAGHEYKTEWNKPIADWLLLFKKPSERVEV